MEGVLHSIEVFVRTSAGGHDDQLAAFDTVGTGLLGLKSIDKIEAVVNPVGLELEEVESTAQFLGPRLMREVNQLA